MQLFEPIGFLRRLSIRGDAQMDDNSTPNRHTKAPQNAKRNIWMGIKNVQSAKRILDRGAGKKSSKTKKMCEYKNGNSGI